MTQMVINSRMDILSNVRLIGYYAVMKTSELLLLLHATSLVNFTDIRLTK